MLPEFASKLCLDFLEIQRLEGTTRAPINLGLVPYDARTEGFRKPAHGLTKIPLEEFHNRRRKVKLFCSIDDVFLREGV